MTNVFKENVYLFCFVSVKYKYIAVVEEKQSPNGAAVLWPVTNDECPVRVN